MEQIDRPSKGDPDRSMCARRCYLLLGKLTLSRPRSKIYHEDRRPASPGRHTGCVFLGAAQPGEPV